MWKNDSRPKENVDTQLFIEIMTWFIDESGHPGCKETSISEECTQPILIEDSKTRNNTDCPVNASLETTYEGETFFLICSRTFRRQICI